MKTKQNAETVSISVLSKVLNLDWLLCPQIWNIVERESRHQVSKAQQEIEQQRARVRDKNKGDIFCWKKFCSGGEKMRDACGHQGDNDRQWKKKVNKNAYNISSLKRVTRKFLEVSCCTCAKQWQRNVPKKCAARAKLLFG